MTTSKILLTFNDIFHKTHVVSSFDTQEQAQTELTVNQEKFPEVIFKLSSVIIENATATFEEEIGGIVEVDAVVDGVSESITFCVQLCAGRYESQNGCWITTTDGDFEFSEAELVVYEVCDVIGLAEKSAKEHDEENYQYHDTDFNCAINSSNLYACEEKTTSNVTLVLIDSSHNSVCDYGSSQEELESFESLEAAMDHLKQFRTEDYQDWHGLSAYINSHS